MITFEARLDTTAPHLRFTYAKALKPVEHTQPSLQSTSAVRAGFQLNAGLRSKRFAMVTNGGVVQHLAVDDGDTDMVDTSAEKLLEVLAPKGSAAAAAAAIDPQPVLLLALLAALGVAYTSFAN